MKYVISMILVVVVGTIIGFFGVINSVFSDGGIAERIGTVVVIVGIYAILSGLLGFFMPKYSWLMGLLLCMPGVLMLILYMRSEFNVFYLVYIAVLLATSCLVSYGCGKIGERRTRRTHDIS